MKKSIFLLFIISLLSLSSCTESVPTNEDYNQVNESFTNTGNTSKGFNQAEISGNKDYEATETVPEEEIQSGETATITSFESGSQDLSGGGN